MRHPSGTGHVGTSLPAPTTPPESSIGGIAEWDPAYERPLSPHAHEDAERLEAQAKKGVPVTRPDSFPEDLWNTLAISVQAEFVARSNYGEEDGGGKDALETWKVETNLAFDLYTGPDGRRKGLPSTPRPSSMIGKPEALRPHDVWMEIEEVAKKELCLPLPPEVAENLRVVYTGREGQLMLLVITSQDLARYVSGVEPCPVVVNDSPGYLTIHGEAQGYANQGMFGAAADWIGRLAYFAGEPAKAKPVGGGAPDNSALDNPLG
jgi:hypothetical protein